VGSTSGSSRFLVGSAINHPAHPRLRNRPRTHHTRLERHDNRRAIEAPGATGCGRLLQSLHLGVTGGIPIPLSGVPSLADDVPRVIDDHCPDRNIT